MMNDSSSLSVALLSHAHAEDDEESPVQKIMLKRFDILKFYKMDILEHNFKCQFILVFRLPRCAHLPRESGTDANGNPTLSVPWYISKIEPQNLSGEGEEWKRVNTDIWTEDNDMIIALCFQGTLFLEDMDLKDFPFDTQDVKIRMIYLCKTENLSSERRHLCAKFDLETNRDSTLNMAGFMNPKLSWEPVGEPDGTVNLDCKVGNYNAAGRTFPELTATFRVKRLQRLVDIVLPAGLIAGLSLMTFWFPYDTDDSALRLETSLALTIAAAAYLQVVSTKVPQINYMTRLDKYVFSNFATLLAVTLANGLMFICVDKGINFTVLNWILFGVLVAGWVCTHVRWILANCNH